MNKPTLVRQMSLRQSSIVRWQPYISLFWLPCWRNLFFCFPRSFPQILTISGDSIRADIIFSTSWPVSVYTDTTITDTTITDTTITTPATTVSNAAASLTTDIYNYLLFFFFQVSSNHPYHHCYCVQSSTAAATNYFPDSYIFVSHSILTYPPRVPRFPLRFYCRCHHYD